MPKGNKNLIQSLRSAHDPHFKLEGRVEELEKKLPIQIADLHKTLSKSFGMQRKTLVRVLALEKKIGELKAAKEKVEEVVKDIGEDKIKEVVDDIKEEKTPEEKAPQEETASEEEIPEGLDDVLDDIRGEKEEDDGTETKKPTATKKKPKKKPRKKPTARKIPTKKPVAKKKKISAENLKKGTVLDDDFKSRVMGEDEEGEYLSPEERKIRFKKSKISSDDIRGTKPVDPPPEPTSQDEGDNKETEGLQGIRDVLDDILKVLRLDFKGDRKEARDAQKEGAQKKRSEREGKLEGGIKKSVGVIGKAAGALLKPFKSIWDQIIEFLKSVFLGALFTKTMKWFSDPKNKKKAESIGKFFKDWWPALATAAALFLTPLGALVNGVVGLLTAIIPKLVMAIAANPYAALALVGTGLAVWGISKMASGGKDKKQKPVGNEGDEGEGVTTMKGGGLVESSPIQKYNEGGLVNDQGSAQNFIHKFNEGGLVPGYNEGGSVKDFDKSHYGTEGYQIGQVNPPTLIVSQEKFEEKIVTKNGEIVDDKSYEKFSEMIASIGVPDLMEHQGQLVGEINKVPGYENINIEDVLNKNVNMPLDQYLPILMNSDAQKATFAKWDAAHQADLQLRGITDTSKGFSMGYNGGGLVQGFAGGGLVGRIKNAGANVLGKAKAQISKLQKPRVDHIHPPQTDDGGSKAAAAQVAQGSGDAATASGDPAPGIPNFDAAMMRSQSKIRTLGVSV